MTNARLLFGEETDISENVDETVDQISISKADISAADASQQLSSSDGPSAEAKITVEPSADADKINKAKIKELLGKASTHILKYQEMSLEAKKVLALSETAKYQEKFNEVLQKHVGKMKKATAMREAVATGQK